MFFCESCRQHNGWPVSLLQSKGVCEVCGIGGVNCYDIPSSRLPLPDGVEEVELGDIYADAHFWLKRGRDGEWKQVSRQQYTSAEAAAGFYPTGRGDVATFGFDSSGARGYISGAITFGDGPPFLDTSINQ